MTKNELKKIVDLAVKNLNLGDFNSAEFIVEIPSRQGVGDYFTNAPHVIAGKFNPNKSTTENDIKRAVSIFKPELEKLLDPEIVKIEDIGGFINFRLADKVFIDNLKNIDKNYGKGKELKGKKVIIDYTDPNPFKEFHIGHLMSNAIGESLSRIFEFQGAKVKRVCYQGDVGMHVAKAIWGKIKDGKKTWGQAYAFGAQAYEEDEKAKKEITGINKKIYDRSDKKINKLYDTGKKDSLKYFDKIYKKLDTRFDYFVFESQTGEIGKKIVEKWLVDGIFEKGLPAQAGENAPIIFKGEKYGLHTRVFINSEGLPTYEAKDLGLAEIKYKKYKYDQSFVVTGNEINEYFKVMLCALDKINPELAKKTRHIGHGMLRLPEGKMSSRTGKVITAESLIEKVEELINQKIKDRELSKKEKQEITEKVAIGAIKYYILKQSIGSDIIYDFDKSVSFEGDSGPYLQYSCTRAESVLRKAKKEGVRASFSPFGRSPAGGKKVLPEISELEKKIIYFPEIVSKAQKSCQPHYISLYLTELAAIFNAYYVKNKIVDKKDINSPYRTALTAAFAQIMKNGLWLLGINTLERM